MGGGFGGLQAVRGLRRAPVDVTLIDRRNFHLFQPLLYQAATGAVSPDEIATPLRSIVKRQKNVRVVLGEVCGFDLERRCVAIGALASGERGAVVPYDTLIVAGGSRYSFFGHEEWRQFALEVKSLESALEVRSRIFTAFEAAETESDSERRAAWLTFVVVGGGPTGVEMAGQIAELARDALPREFRSADIRQARILLVETTDRVLGTFPPRLSAKAARALARLGVTVMLGTTVTDVDAGSVTCRTPDGALARVPARTVIWAAGVVASDLAGMLAAAAGARQDRAGRVEVGPGLTVHGRDEVIALGDMVSVHDGEAAHALPGLATVAMQQGRYARTVGPCAPTRRTAPALSLRRQGKPRHHRARPRRGGHQRRPAQRHPRLDDLARRAHLLPHRLAEPRARPHALGGQLRHPRPERSTHRRDESNPECKRTGRVGPGECAGDDASRRSRSMTYVISEPCIDVKDRSCVDVCPWTASTRSPACS